MITFIEKQTSSIAVDMPSLREELMRAKLAWMRAWVLAKDCAPR